MSVFHDFIFFNEKEDKVVVKIGIEDEFFDFINSEVEFGHNIYESISTVNPCKVEKPYGDLIPTEKGFSYTGIMVVNHYSIKDLKAMFLQWMELLNKIESDKYYYDLVYLSDDELSHLSQEEIEALKEHYFEKKLLFEKLHCCLDHVVLLEDPHYILILEGI